MRTFFSFSRTTPQRTGKGSNPELKAFMISRGFPSGELPNNFSPATYEKYKSAYNSFLAEQALKRIKANNQLQKQTP